MKANDPLRSSLAVTQAVAGNQAAPATSEDHQSDEPESAAKRRRRSADRDVASAGASPVKANGHLTAEGQVQSTAGIKAEPVNGASVNADGAVKPEAAFWTALEDSKDEVSCVMAWPSAWLRACCTRACALFCCAVLKQWLLCCVLFVFALLG